MVLLLRWSYYWGGLIAGVPLCIYWMSLEILTGLEVTLEYIRYLINLRTHNIHILAIMYVYILYMLYYYVCTYIIWYICYTIMYVYFICYTIMYVYFICYTNVCILHMLYYNVCILHMLYYNVLIRTSYAILQCT